MCRRYPLFSSDLQNRFDPAVALCECLMRCGIDCGTIVLTALLLIGERYHIAAKILRPQILHNPRSCEKSKISSPYNVKRVRHFLKTIERISLRTIGIVSAYG